MSKVLVSMAVLLCSIAWGGCAEPLPDDVVTETSNLFLVRDVTSRPYRDANVTYDGCCNAPWTIVGGGNRVWSHVNEGRCNGTDDYVWVGSLGDYPYYGTFSVDMDLTSVPNGSKVNEVRAWVCARPHVKTVTGNFKGSVYYWNPEGRGHVWFYDPEELETTYVPGVSYFAENRFSLIEVDTRHSATYPASLTGKTDTSGMRLRFLGDNLDISQVYLNLNISVPTTVPPPGDL